MSHLGEHMFARAYMQFGDEIANLGLNLNASTYGHKIEFYAFGLEASVLEFVEEILLHDDKSVLRHTHQVATTSNASATSSSRNTRGRCRIRSRRCG